MLSNNDLKKIIETLERWIIFQGHLIVWSDKV